MQDFTVGIDGSVSSTGVAILHHACGSEILIGWTHGKRLAAKRRTSRSNARTCLCQRLRMIRSAVPLPHAVVEQCLKPYVADFLLTRILPYPKVPEDASYEARLDLVTSSVVYNIALFVPDEARVEFKCEAVPLHMEHSSSVSILRDFSAVLRHKLYVQWTHGTIQELSPSTIKKVWTGRGNSKKPDMYHHFRIYYAAHGFPVPNKSDLEFYGFLQQQEDNVKSERKPLQDMVDARAIAGNRRRKPTTTTNKKTNKKKRTYMMLSAK